MIKMNRAFTLVELIVVITILGILGTIGFVSFTGYLSGTRDTNRMTQLRNIGEGLKVYRLENKLPLPESKIEIKKDGKVIAYQGYMGKDALETIKYTEDGKDPKDGNYFSYYLTKNRKYFQLMTFLEEENTQAEISLLNSTFATDYSERFPFVNGNKLGILTDENNTPIQEITTISGSGYLDVSNVGDLKLKSFLKEEEYVEGSGMIIINELQKLKDIGNRGGRQWMVTDNKFMHGLCAISQDPNIVSDFIFVDKLLDGVQGYYVQSNTCLKWQAQSGPNLAWAKNCSTDSGDSNYCGNYTDPEWKGNHYDYNGHYPSGRTENDFQAHKYCENLGVGWRLPTKREMFSIITEYEKNNSGKSTKLDSISSSYYLTSTTNENNSKDMWYGKFYYNTVYYSVKRGNYRTICIHD